MNSYCLNCREWMDKVMVERNDKYDRHVFNCKKCGNSVRVES